MLTGENGILNQAVKAREQTDIKNAEEQVKLAIMGSYGQDGKISLSDLKNNLNQIEGITGPIGDITKDSFPLAVTIDGKQIELNMNEDGTVTAEAKVETNPSTPTYTAYAVGDTFTVGGETFYVIEESDANTEIVKGLAAKNIDTTTMAQSDSAGTVAFSSTNYWSSISGITYPYDLNNTATSAETDAIAITKEYAKKLDKSVGTEVTGRLLTLEEVVALGGDVRYGRTSNCPSWLNSDGFWLSTAYDDPMIFYVDRSFGYISF